MYTVIRQIFKTTCSIGLLLFSISGHAATSTICASATAPEGWIKVDTQTDFTKCRDWEKNNVAIIETTAGKTEMQICAGQNAPSGWLITDVSTNWTTCQLRQNGPGSITGYGTVAKMVKTDSQSQLQICSNQPLPTGWSVVSTATVAGRCITPNYIAETWSRDNVWTVVNNNVTCAISVTPSEVAPGGSWTFTISGANIPAGSTAYWYGTKDGVLDYDHVYAGPLPYKQSFVNRPAWAGVYTRYVKIFNTAGSEICTSNVAAVALRAPVCTLSGNAAYIGIGQPFSFSVQTDPSLPVGLKGYWYGSKNGVPDEFGAVSISVPGTASNVNQTGWTGKYVRWLEVRNGSEVQCRTNSVSMELQ